MLLGCQLYVYVLLWVSYHVKVVFSALLGNSVVPGILGPTGPTPGATHARLTGRNKSDSSYKYLIDYHFIS